MSSTTDKIHHYHRLLHHLLFLKRKETYMTGSLEPDLNLKIKHIFHILFKLKEELVKEKNLLAAEEREKAFDLMLINREKTAQAQEKKKHKKEIELAIIRSSIPEPYVIILRPNVDDHEINKEYELFINELLCLKNEDGKPRYHPVDFVYTPASPYQMRPVFRFPNAEVAELFSKRLLEKKVVTLAFDIKSMKQFMAEIRQQQLEQNEFNDSENSSVTHSHN